MNYNDKIQTEEAFVLHTEEDQQYECDILKSSDSDNRVTFSSKGLNNNTQKAPLLKGKENNCTNITYNQTKNLPTNHSFNGYFTQNQHKQQNKSTIEASQNHMQFTKIPSKTFQITSPTNFNSSGKLSNLQFVNDSASNSIDTIHPEVKAMMKKYFLQIWEYGNVYGQYMSAMDFVDLLFEEFQYLVGGANLIEDFTEKVAEMFGDKIYFENLFQRTSENGLKGLILEVVKAMDEDKKHANESKQSKIMIKQHGPIQRQGMFKKSQINSNFESFKNQRNPPIIEFIKSKSNMDQPFNNRSNTTSTKISLDKFFGSTVSKVQNQQDSTQFGQENLEQVKQILQDYIETMYEEAEQKLSKKYNQEMKKITLKYKEVEKLLQKINDKISNHYDTLQLTKEYEKKIKVLKDRQNDLENKIKSLQLDLKVSRDDLEKQKLIHFKTDQDCAKLKQKLQKYENAIFQKAMQKNSSQTSLSSTSIKDHQQSTSSSIFSQQSLQPTQQVTQQNPPHFQLKIDTFTESRPMITPLTSTITKTTYTPYVSRLTTTNLTPSRAKEGSVSPIRQRISFVKTQNPLQATKQSSNQRSLSPAQVNSRIVYLNNVNSVAQNSTQSRLKTSNVQKIELGQKISLRPLSPINRVSQGNGGLQGSRGRGIKPLGQVASPYHGGYSPIKVQFCTSRVSTMSGQNR